jgi:hypothetical protein
MAGLGETDVSSRRPRFYTGGGNFLFEDGRVQWYKFRNITLGSMSRANPGYAEFYKIQIP